MFSGKKLFGHPARLLRVGLVSNVVALEHVASAVSGDLHDDRLRDSGPAEIADGGSTQVMEKKTGHAGSRTCQSPAFTKILDRLCSAGLQQLPTTRRCAQASSKRVSESRSKDRSYRTPFINKPGVP